MRIPEIIWLNRTPNTLTAAELEKDWELEQIDVERREKAIQAALRAGEEDRAEPPSRLW